ncbi:MAG: tRNA pseudouridine(55) synthase TruB [Bordetella sp.]|nr:MAG: tRNA pseudouridine(55) synthase TruB [Bordetella sp.]
MISNKIQKEMLDGVILLDKPAGLSSNQALQRVKRKLGAAKAGHMGTLDPFATGLLICCLGRATKISDFILKEKKTYRATIQFGKETDSGDLTGKVISSIQSPINSINQKNIEFILPDFLGTIQQVPPMYSALKKNGKPLYKYARQGIEIKRPPREINVYDIKLLKFNQLEAEIEVMCGRGTYIRVLAQDIGRKIGSYAHVLSLKRTRIGPFFLNQSISLNNLESMKDPKMAMLSLNELPTSLVT